MKFRKRSLVVDASRWTGSNLDEIQALIGGNVARAMGGDLLIGALEGEIRASVLDWVICDERGEVSVCPPDIFYASFENAEPEERSTVDI